MSGDLEDVKLDSETDLEPEVNLIFFIFCVHVRTISRSLWACVGR